MKAKELKKKMAFYVVGKDAILYYLKDCEEISIHTNDEIIPAILVNDEAGDMVVVPGETEVVEYKHESCSVCGSTNCGGNHCPHCGELDCYDIHCEEKHYWEGYDSYHNNEDPLSCEKDEHRVSVPDLIDITELEVNDD